MKVQIHNFLAVVLVLLTILSMNWELLSNRWLRVITGVSFLLLAFQRVKSNKTKMAIIFIGLLCCDLLLLEWEYIPSKFFYYTFHSGICAYLIFLMYQQLQKERKIEVSIPEGLALFLFFAINSGILLRLGSFFSEIITDPLLIGLFYLNGFLIIILVILAFFYTSSFASKFSSYFFVSVLGLTISDLMVFAIYFLDFPEFKYFDNFFYILGLNCLTGAFMVHSRSMWKETDSIPLPEETEVVEKELKVGTYR